MTRETKIGLLVGLAFIIVIGILLSDHMTSTTDPPKAPLSMAGPNVRESVAAPTSGNGATASATAAPPAVTAPGQPVLTQQELVPPQQPQQQAQRQAVQMPPVQTIQVGPGPVQVQPPITIQQTAQAPVAPQQPTVIPQPQWQQPAPPAAQPPVTVATAGQRRGAGHPLQGVAGQHGEEVVVVGEPTGLSQGGANPPVPMSPLREYKAQAGDSLSKIASRFLGGNTKTNRDAIVRANASLQQNPDKIVEGRTYLLPVGTAPAPAGAPATPVAVAPPAPAPVEASAPAAQQAEAAAQGAFSWYTVKENDNLWRIAADQLGTGTAAKQIKDLNGDVLKGNDNLQVGMRLRIPPKPVASAN
jgi:nucleoid-associated protein YgaU